MGGGCHLRSQLLPSLEKVLRSHFCGLEKLVEHHWKFHCDVLQSATVSAHTRNQDCQLARRCYIYIYMSIKTTRNNRAVCHTGSAAAGCFSVINVSLQCFRPRPSKQSPRRVGDTETVSWTLPYRNTRGSYLNWMLSTGASLKSDRHSMLRICWT